MSIFVQRKNIMTGSTDWIVQNENYDYHQEVARSSFADMLHDTERNRLYEKALKKGIENIHRQGKKALVLDIGTGTGLRSMMAVRNGADKVTACEAFKPMSECALKIIKQNGFEKKIRVIPKRSTDLVVGNAKDLDEKCNILVTEVFDTELIGEGALSTFQHAHEKLLESDCIVIPNSATIYAQVVECPLVLRFNRMHDLSFKNETIKIPDSIKNCSGCAAVHDVQLSQIPRDSFKTIVSPKPIFKFDWSGRTALKYNRTNFLKLKSEDTGQAQAVFMWWTLDMDTEGEIVLSCAPVWEHPAAINGEIPWRDHWMQAIYYFPEEVNFNIGEELFLSANHDEYSLWFKIQKTPNLKSKNNLNPVCSCGFHLFPRTRIGQINDMKKNNVLLNTVTGNVVDKVVLVIGNGFYLSLIARKFFPKKLIILDNNLFSKRVMVDFLNCNAINDVEIVDSVEELRKIVCDQLIDIVLAEPYFTTSILPWDNLFFYYTILKIKDLLKDCVELSPKAVTIKVIAVHFTDLHKIRMPLGVCEGFEMEEFDKLIDDSCSISDDLVEAQPLWEYPNIALSHVVDMLHLDFSVNPKLEVLESKKNVTIECMQPCNGLVFWVDWHHIGTSSSIITTGPVSTPVIGNRVSWDMNSRQGVCLFEERLQKSIECSFKLDLANGIATVNYR